MARQDRIFTRGMYGGETTYGTAATRTNEISRLQQINWTEDNGLVYERGAGEGVNVQKIYYGPYNTSANITFNVNDFDFLKHWVGPKTGAGTSGDKYTLTEATDIEANTTSLQPFSLEMTNTSESSDDVALMLGAIGNDFTLSGSVNGILSCSANCFGRKTTRPASATSYTPVTENSYIMLGGSWKYGSTPTAVDGIRSFTLNYGNGITPDDHRDANSRFVNKATLTNRSYSGQLVIAMSKAQADIIYADFYGDTITNGPEDGSTASEYTADLEFNVNLVNGSKNANIWLDQVSIDSLERGGGVDGGLVLMTVNFTAKEAKDNTPITWWTA
jgi:hypothetical protein